MQDYINLINFLKENDESVRKDLETLKFGTEISWCDDRYNIGDKLNIIGNDLDYHHIMMYCENNKIKCSIFGVGYIVFKKRLKRIFLLDFDNTKPLHEQEPIVYKQLLEYFISIK